MEFKDFLRTSPKIQGLLNSRLCEHCKISGAPLVMSAGRRENVNKTDLWGVKWFQYYAIDNAKIQQEVFTSKMTDWLFFFRQKAKTQVYFSVFLHKHRTSTAFLRNWTYRGSIQFYYQTIFYNDNNSKNNNREIKYRAFFPRTAERFT